MNFLELLEATVSILMAYFIICLMIAMYTRPKNHQQSMSLFSRAIGNVVFSTKSTLFFLTKTKAQRVSLLIFAVNFLILGLYALLHNDLDCYTCEIADYIPNRRTPFFYDLFFWLGVFSLTFSILGGKSKVLINWIRRGS